MSRIQRVVLDTSTLVSAALQPGSIPGQVISKALRNCELCASAEKLDELAQVLDRDKFDRYRVKDSRRSFVALIRRRARLFAVENSVMIAIDPRCRDPKDEKFPALALASEAHAVVSSDEDLLVLHPWRGIPILKPAEFLDEAKARG